MDQRSGLALIPIYDLIDFCITQCHRFHIGRCPGGGFVRIMMVSGGNEVLAFVKTAHPLPCGDADVAGNFGCTQAQQPGKFSVRTGGFPQQGHDLADGQLVANQFPVHHVKFVAVVERLDRVDAFQGHPQPLIFHQFNVGNHALEGFQAEGQNVLIDAFALAKGA